METITRRTRESPSLLWFWVPPIVLGLMGIYLVVNAASVAQTGCQDTQNFLPDRVLLGFSLVGLLAGRYFVRLHPTPIATGGQRWSSVVGIFALILFFLAAATALIYEGVGVTEAAIHGKSALQQLEPITQYVRCAVYYDKLYSPGNVGFASYFAFFVTSFLVGNWLWPDRFPRALPPGPPDPEPMPLVPPVVGVLGSVIVAVVLVWVSANLLGVAFGATPELQAITAASTGDSFRQGIRIVVGFVFGVFFLISVLDLVFVYRGWESIPMRLERWSRSNAVFVWAWVFVLSLLVVHFVGNRIKYD
jgi:hypothetical protein